ncbi:MAG: hypothetical protein Q9217_003002 [Psora testacea]
MSDAKDPYKCEATLTTGQWLDSSDISPTARTFENWQPDGCMLKNFQPEGLGKCFEKGQQIVYIGDSSIRELFWATARKTNAEQAYREQHLAQKHTDLKFEHDNLSLVFLWDPYLNSSNLQEHLSTPSTPSQASSPDSNAAIILVGGGLWHARYLGEDSLPDFTKAIENITAFMNKEHASIPQTQSTLKLLAPVQIPWYESLNHERSQTITPSRVEAMNEHLLQLTLQHGVPIAWAFSLMSLHQPAAYDPSGLHPAEKVADRMMDIVLNMKCNALLMQDQVYPMDFTCCTGYAPLTWTQRISLIFSIILLALMPVITYKYSKTTFLPPRKVTRALADLAMAICYCYYADRTQLWNKGLKQYDPQGFVILCMATVALGFLSIRRSNTSSTRGKAPSPAKAPDQLFLSRDQTDEFKGWMQVLILIYHYLGASKILPIYEVIRLLVASYLFMTGFGHAVFFYRKSDYSLRRCAAVLIRLNLLSIILPYIMKTDYLFYYFAPLTSFWYIIVFLTMYTANQRNHSLYFLTSKIILSATLTNIVIRATRIFEGLFQLLERTCNIHWNSHEWRFRLELDSYIVYVGMLCGILFAHSTDALRLTSNDNSNSFDIFMRTHFHKLRLVALVLALVTPPVFYFFARNAANKYEFNKWMPYASTPAILSYVILRNSSRHARNYYSSIFAWMGQHSLETFTLQFHIWLAADTKGLLKTGMLDRWFGQLGEFIGLSIVFLWICWHVSAATQTLTSWIVDPSTGSDDAETYADDKGESLPRIKSKEELRMVNGVGVGVGRGASGVRSWIAESLRVRLAIIVLALWVINVTY